MASASLDDFSIAGPLVEEGRVGVGYFGITDHCDIMLKRRCNRTCSRSLSSALIEAILEDAERRTDCMSTTERDVGVLLTAQHGARVSVEDLLAHLDADIEDWPILTHVRSHACPQHRHMAYDSCPAYGAILTVPYAAENRGDTQISFDAATTKTTVACAHAHTQSLPNTVFRTSTANMPWHRPCMSRFDIKRFILRGEQIDVFRRGYIQSDPIYINVLVRMLIDGAQDLHCVPTASPCEGVCESGLGLSCGLIC